MSYTPPSPEELELVLYPDPRLRAVATPIKEVDDELRARVEAMAAILYKAKGIGLAGNQVGWLQRICLINPSGDPGKHEVLINPEILSAKSPVSQEEGCLSLPRIYGQVTRPGKLQVRYTNLDGEVVERAAVDLEATVIQHELDHLDGILFITKVTPADRMRMKKQLIAMDEDYKEAQDESTGVPSS